MKIELKEIPIREVVAGYVDNAINGVRGYGGRLNIRPAFQREFIYKDKQRDEVINTVRKNYPLNVMYWARSGDGDFELLDGQQRTISLCQYVHGGFMVGFMGFANLTEEERAAFLDYPLMVYICEGDEREKLDWFKIINIAGTELAPQELRNAIYTGEWLAAAKKYFSKPQCQAQNIAGDYLGGSMIRQDFLETALKWIAAKGGQQIEDYMAAHQHDTNCNELWLYFQSVINWTAATFPHYRREMKGLDWGIFYNKFGSAALDPAALEEKIAALMMDDDVTSKKGIYEYLLDGQEKHLSIRAFSPAMRRAAYERQKGKCAKCGKKFSFDEMQADHITPWSKGGTTTPANCKMLCAGCNRQKSDI